jgi:hypothetical protein
MYLIVHIALIFLGFDPTNTNQEIFQNVRGVVYDKVSREPLTGATVILLDSTNLNAVSCDAEGKFRISNVRLGRQILRVSYLGYKEMTIQFIVTSGKEVIVEIELEQSVIQGKTVDIVAERQKDKPNNEMAIVSARSFTVEETSRYAGGLNDPSRMAANYAGVTSTSDARNDIIIRGNSPIGLLWRLNGIEIPNPNHFGSLGTTGGPVSILNNNQLDKSDFFTGAFPAEYGNTVSGVFDLQMRSGNNEKTEFLGQVGFNGFELGAEGPFNSKGRSSYIINYRYSTLGIFKALGINFGAGTVVPQYQDLSFKVDIQSGKSGRLSVFGMGGLSYVEILDAEQDTTQKNLYAFNKRQNGYFGNHMGVLGVQHLFFFNSTTYSRLNISLSSAGQDYKVDSINEANNTPHPLYRNGSNQIKTSLNYNWNKKFSSRDYLKIGFIADRYHYTFKDSSFEKTFWQKYSDFNSAEYLIQTYAQLQHKFSDHFSLNTGIHYQYFEFNKTNSLEPRLGLRWEMKSGQSISVAAGLHSQLQPMYIYFQKSFYPDSTYIETNRNVGFTKSKHYVIAIDKSIGKDMRIKTELYFQDIYDVPVETRPTWYSILNEGADFGIGNVDSLVNKGKGENYGVELTVEKFYSRGYYYLFTGSLYSSKYKGSDGILRNTVFNGNFTANVLGGKEWTIKSKNVFAFNIKITYAGGKRYIPIDIAESQIANETRFDHSHAYENRLKDYFRTDVKLSYRINKKKSTHEFSIDIDNIFNTKNIWNQQYDPKSQSVKTQYQLGIFPIPQFRITF